MKLATSKPGIYLITCIVNQKQYVGSTSRSFTMRWNCHKGQLRRGQHGNKYLQRSWDKYCEHSFIFEILEVVDDPNLLIEREQFYIDTLNPMYNIGRSAINPMLGRHHDEATNQKNREAHLGRHLSDEAKQKLSRSIKGHPNYLLAHTEEAKRKISIGLTGRPVSEDTRSKIGSSNQQRWSERLPLRAIISPSGVIFMFRAAQPFAKQHGLTSTKLCAVLNGEQRHHKGWTLPSLIQGIVEVNRT